uniref:Serpentine receptor class gamma n=1 Tax=Panagrellus redivivus TaxID=6233 RepID=A0A7E4VNB9_PANRE
MESTDASNVADVTTPTAPLTTTVPPLRELARVLVYTQYSIYYVGIAFEFTVVLFFYYSYIKRSDERMRTPYFVLIIFGYSMDFANSIMFVLELLLTSTTTGEGIDLEYVSYVSTVISWFTAALLGPWNVTLIINRTTAIIFWKYHDRIWCKKNMIFLFIGFAIYPFILSGYAIYEDPMCFIDFYADECIDYTNKWQTFDSFFTVGFSIIAMTIGLTTILVGRKMTGHVAATMAKYEKRLFFQAFASAIGFMTNSILSVFAVYYLDQRRRNMSYWAYIILSLLTNLSFICYYYPMMAVMVIVSPPVWQGYLKFYRLHCIIKRILNKNNNPWAVVSSQSGPRIVITGAAAQTRKKTTY